MDIEGVVRNGVIIPEGELPLPEGARVRITVSTGEIEKTFGERFGSFRGRVPDLPADLSQQHEHYRLGTPKR